MPPREVLALLNRYFDRMSVIVEIYLGVVDKYMGDAIMALFGAPVAHPNHADSAILAALEMKSALARLNAELATEGRAKLAFGIGINTSKIIAGNIGSSRRLNYSVLGDGVNVAARLQDLTRMSQYRADILVSAATLEGGARTVQGAPARRRAGQGPRRARRDIRARGRGIAAGPADVPDRLRNRLAPCVARRAASRPLPAPPASPRAARSRPPAPSRWATSASSTARSGGRWSATPTTSCRSSPTACSTTPAGTPGLEPKGESYGGWESHGIAGHTLGHYLTALSQQYRRHGRHAVPPERIDYIVAEMAECQKAYGDGYIGALPPLELQTMRNFREGIVEPQGPFNFKGGAWVPWYTEHKVLNGLKDAWILGGSAQARDVALKLADWVDSITAGLTPEQLQAMLSVEQGGMMDVLVELYALTGNPRYLEASRRFYHRAVLDPLLARRDELPGKHANTQIPKIIGEARTYEATGDPQRPGDRRVLLGARRAPLLLRHRRQQRGRAPVPRGARCRTTSGPTRRRPATPTTCSS